MADGPRTSKPTKADLERADGVSIQDLVRPGLRLLLVGINPGRYSGATCYHFGNPASRLWPALHLSGWTSRRLLPSDTDELLRLGIGITNFVSRTTRTAAELSKDDVRNGAAALRIKVRELRPHVVAILGKTAYETGFDSKHVVLGPQTELLAGSALWVLPNPSGLNARYPLPYLVEGFRQIRRSLEESSSE